MKKLFFLFFLITLPFFPGCVGFSLPHVGQMKPYTYVRGGDQFGRDQLANRFLVAQLKIPIKGLHSNEVLSVLGQPQQINILEKDVSEDWYYIYYKNYKTQPNTDEGTFVVSFDHSKVIDVIRQS